MPTSRVSQQPVTANIPGMSSTWEHLCVFLGSISNDHEYDERALLKFGGGEDALATTLLTHCEVSRYFIYFKSNQEMLAISVRLQVLLTLESGVTWRSRAKLVRWVHRHVTCDVLIDNTLHPSVDQAPFGVPLRKESAIKKLKRQFNQICVIQLKLTHDYF